MRVDALSPGEMQAERLYALLRTGRMGRQSFVFNARSLELHHPLGALYLRFLIISALNKR